MCLPRQGLVRHKQITRRRMTLRLSTLVCTLDMVPMSVAQHELDNFLLCHYTDSLAMLLLTFVMLPFFYRCIFISD